MNTYPGDDPRMNDEGSIIADMMCSFDNCTDRPEWDWCRELVTMTMNARGEVEYGLYCETHTAEMDQEMPSMVPVDPSTIPVIPSDNGD